MKVRESLLTAISISSELSFVWMAVNPPNSPNLTKKEKGEETDEEILIQLQQMYEEQVSG